MPYCLKNFTLICFGSKITHANTRKSTAKGEVETIEKFECIKSSLEPVEREIHDRYLQIRLKYAKVEAQLKELVTNLKTAKN
ncbi:hypothetical protein CISIN_1g036814mg [Citrus sinensis]|uniref:Uncharacterized protein n=1 Tax=Citrus sinensis TaxID=2711 RepID=A0A067EBF6_CITSI|nr:hypothetical protein CISIN_1g036814mg [Citrus sinensis]